MMQAQATVFAIDGDPAVCQAVRHLADAMGLRCRTYSSGQAFLETYDRAEPGCLVLEIRIADLNGLDVQHRLAAEGSPLPVVFLTGHRDVSMAVRAMRAGALNFLEKRLCADELQAAIEEAVALDKDRRRACEQSRQLHERLQRLTRKQRQVLKMIGEGKSNRAMAAALGITLRAVELRRMALLRRLNASTTIELVYHALVAAKRSLASQRALSPPRGTPG